ncbi:MAG: cupin domain-containing protein [Rhizobiaceae bacterium]|nr:cupin domain-containing protein [Rhizobiaceae bacterium]
MSVVDSVSPVGSGPPRHIHHREDETFILLSGECEFWLEGETFFRGPGQTVFVPRGAEHTFRVIGDIPSRHLIVLTPGGFEGFFSEMAEGRFDVPDDMPAISEIAGRYELSFTGPPLGANESM